MAGRELRVTHAQLATVALTTIAEAKVGADDATLAMVQAARQMLHGIASGQFVVAPAPKEQPAAAPLPQHPREEIAGQVVSP
jgi:hypothetical protein